MLELSCILTTILLTGGPGAEFAVNENTAINATGRQLDGTASNRERYLLMRDYKIVAGFIEETENEFIVSRAGAKMSLPKTRALYLGEAMEDLYQYRAERVPEKDSHMRFQLAQWCFNNGMIEQSLAEAKLVLSITPSDERASRLVNLCEARIRPVESTPYVRIQQREEPRRPRDPDPSRVIGQFKSAYGQDLFNDFKSLEPLLANSCGNAACHGTARHEGPFRLYRRFNDAPTDIKLTSRNLLSMLEAIDYRNPMHSPLLFKALERHGASTLPPLGGVQDPTYIALQEWVIAIADRWSGNEIELDPIERRELAQERQDRDEEFAEGRRRESPVYVRRTGRPRRPSMEPGDDISRVPLGFGPAMADDAPPASEMMSTSGTGEQTRWPERRSEGYREQAPQQMGDQGTETDAISAEEMMAPIEEPVEVVTQKPGRFRSAANRLIGIVGGRPRSNKMIRIPTDKVQMPEEAEGDFEAAPLPLGLEPALPIGIEKQ